MAKPKEITFTIDGQEYTMKRMNGHLDDLLFQQYVIKDPKTGQVIGSDMAEIWFHRFKNSIVRPALLHDHYIVMDKTTLDSLKAVFMMLNETELGSALNALNPSQKADQDQSGQQKESLNH